MQPFGLSLNCFDLCHLLQRCSQTGKATGGALVVVRVITYDSRYEAQTGSPTLKEWTHCLVNYLQRHCICCASIIPSSSANLHQLVSRFSQGNYMVFSFIIVHSLTYFFYKWSFSCSNTLCLLCNNYNHISKSSKIVIMQMKSAPFIVAVMTTTTITLCQQTLSMPQCTLSATLVLIQHMFVPHILQAWLVNAILYISFKIN